MDVFRIPNMNSTLFMDILMASGMTLIFLTMLISAIFGLGNWQVVWFSFISAWFAWLIVIREI